MRHVRILGVCLAALFAVAAVAASSAMAFPPKNVWSWKYFENCPVNGVAEVEPGVFQTDDLCFFASTEPNEGSYRVGSITVPLVKPVRLQFGSAVNEETGAETFVPASNGAQSLIPGREPVPGEPISHISSAEQEELGWSTGLKESYRQAQKHRASLAKAYEKIEYAGPLSIDRSNLLSEEGTAVRAPVMVRAENRWLSNLGDSCTIGSEAEPIVQELTTGTSVSPLTGEELHGAVGELHFNEAFTEVIIDHSNLVDNKYAVPGAVCTGPFSTEVAATIDKEFGVPAVAGASETELKGTLWNSTAEATAQELGETRE